MKRWWLSFALVCAACGGESAPAGGDGSTGGPPVLRAGDAGAQGTTTGTSGSVATTTSSTTGTTSASTGASTAGGTTSATGSAMTTTGSTTGTSGSTGTSTTTGGTTGSSGSTGTTTAGTSGSTGGSTGTSTGETTGSSTGTSGSDAGVDPDDPYAEVRQVCVDTINEYRATLGLDPLERATPEQEACSDRGAKQDGDSGRAHSSAGSCPGLGAQNTCPGYPVGGFGSATLADALKRCLQQMWDEDEPPQGREACLQEYFDGDTECFLAHGHYLNMSDTGHGTVACGFYEMENGRFWMNQDFGR